MGAKGLEKRGHGGENLEVEVTELSALFLLPSPLPLRGPQTALEIGEVSPVANPFLFLVSGFSWLLLACWASSVLYCHSVYSHLPPKFISEVLDV